MSIEHARCAYMTAPEPFVTELAQLECELERLEDRIDRAGLYGGQDQLTKLLVEQEGLCLKIKALQAKL